MSRIESNAYVKPSDLLRAWDNALPIRQSLVAMQWLNRRNITPALLGGLEKNFRFSSDIKRVLFRWDQYIQARAINDTMTPKYINTRGVKPICQLASFRWWKTSIDPYPVDPEPRYGEVFDGAILTEGIFDAIILRSLCRNSITGFGSKLSPEQIIMLSHPPVNCPFLIWFDSDALTEANLLARELNITRGTLGDIKVLTTPNSQDPSNLGLEKAYHYLKALYPDKYWTKVKDQCINLW